MAVKYKSLQCLAIFIKTDQDNYDKTLINQISLIGQYEKETTLTEVTDCKSATDCKSIQRIITGLIKYQKLNGMSLQPDNHTCRNATQPFCVCQ